MAFIFPGQGSQFVGMAQELRQASRRAKDVLDEIDESLSFSLSDVMLNGPETELNKTVNSQPAIMAASLAALAAFEETQAADSPRPIAYAGHSLGEYTSLVAAASLDLQTGVRLVRRRGELMQQASDNTIGGMAAVIGLDEDSVADICRRADVEIANINSADQIVVSGRKDGIETAIELAKQAGARRVVPLTVAGAFHSQLMASAQKGLNEALSESSFDAPKAPIVANLSAKTISTEDEIRRELEGQICSCVRWKQSVESMVEMGVETFVEFGPGRTLSGLVKRIDRNAKTANVGDCKSLEDAAEKYALL